MRNLTVAELAEVKPPVITLRGVEKVSRIVEVLKNTTHNGFPVIDEELRHQTGDGEEIKVIKLHGLILRAHLVLALKKKWLLQDMDNTTEEAEVRENFSWVELAERDLNFEEATVTKAEMDMYVDLHPLTNTTPFTVLESLSVAKALTLFRQVGLRHLLIIPKYQADGVSSKSSPTPFFSFNETETKNFIWFSI